MAGGQTKSHPLPRYGTRQSDRFAPALDPATLELEDRGPGEWLEFSQQLASFIRFQGLDEASPLAAEGDWRQFFDDFDFSRYRQAPDEFGLDVGRFRLQPHGALFLIYLRMLERLRGDLNRIPGAHLDFYYKDVLKLARKSAKPDSVHVIFEPARTKDLVRIPADTRLNAGKNLTYATDREVFVGKANIESLHSIFADSSATDRPRVAMQSDSLDGYGEPVTDQQPNWKPFGQAALPAMELGFAIASPVLALKEGDRRITATIDLNSNANQSELPSGDQLTSGLGIELSGEEEWLGPFRPTLAVATTVGGSSVKLILEVGISAIEDAVSYHDISKLEGGFDTVSPILKVLIAEKADGRIHRLFSRATVGAIQIEVSVKKAKEFDLENDLGGLNPDKPFMPFGPQPTAGSSIYISSEEVLSKRVTDFKLRLKWQDVPGNLSEHYAAYLESKIDLRKPALTKTDLNNKRDRRVPDNDYFSASMSLETRGPGAKEIPVSLFHPTNAAQAVELDSTPDVRPFEIKPYVYLAKYFASTRSTVRALFPGAVRLVSKSISPISRKRKRRRLRKKLDLRIRTPDRRRREFRYKKRKLGVIRVTLNKSFLHRIYPYYLAATIADKSSTISPAEPYTPMIASIELDYKAVVRYDKFDKDRFAHYDRKTVQLFHITPFGHSEQHAFLKGDLPFVSDKRISLVSPVGDAGSLLIGIANLGEGESINLLVQVAKGTANPSKERQNVEWSLLVRNHWRQFDESEILADETNGLLRSGIVSLKIPLEPLHDNTLMDSAVTWIRASVASDVDAVCDVQAIHLHAVTATVSEIKGDSSANGALLPETITKLRSPVAAVKSVTQPYQSFGGRPPESTNDYYRRASERLRHKQRAVTAADYERLVLEEFPELHMVRCLTHTDIGSCAKPGEVSLIVIPNTLPGAVFDRLKPRVDLDTLSRIGDYVNSLNTHQITADVRNPAYEEVRLSITVRFHPERPFNPYKKFLNEDLVGFLSPWVTSQSSNPTFEGHIHKSQVIKFIEELDYVDFLTNIQLSRDQSTASDLMTLGSLSADAILVSAVSHTIEQAELRR